MLTPYLETSVQVFDRDYESMVDVVSSILVSARGDAGKILLDAYHALSSEKDPRIRDIKMEFIERIRRAYVSIAYSDAKLTDSSNQEHISKVPQN